MDGSIVGTPLGNPDGQESLGNGYKQIPKFGFNSNYHKPEPKPQTPQPQPQPQPQQNQPVQPQPVQNQSPTEPQPPPVQEPIETYHIDPLNLIFGQYPQKPVVQNTMLNTVAMKLK